MSHEPRVGNIFHGFLPADIKRFDSLTELALDLQWSGNHCADEVWRQFDPALWALTQNPWVILQTVAKSPNTPTTANDWPALRNFSSAHTRFCQCRSCRAACRTAYTMTARAVSSIP